jgi:hypothetical protein
MNDTDKARKLVRPYFTDYTALETLLVAIMNEASATAKKRPRTKYAVALRRLADELHSTAELCDCDLL